jgi:anti-sigma B factor antagonist
MELKIRKSGESYIIDVNGEMDLYNSYKLKELVMKMLEKKVTRFIINLENVDYIDSSGIGALIYICSTIKKMGLKLVITNIHGSVKKVIELTKLMGYFPITQTIEEALKRLEAEV